MTAAHKRFELWFAELTARVYEWKYLALVCVLLITMGLASQISKLTIDTRDEGFFHENDPLLMLLP